MTPGCPRPYASHLRIGLHVLVLTLAVVVALRAALLGTDSVIAVVLLVGLFVVVYTFRVHSNSQRQRHLLLLALVSTWIGLELLAADAAYMSLGLFLVFLTELALLPAVAGVVAMTLLDAGLSLVRQGDVEVVVAPLLGAALSMLLGLGYRVLFDVTGSQQSLIAELQRTRAELAESEHAAGQARERQRLAQEIHDTVAQGLSSIQLLLHAVEEEKLPPQAMDRVATAREAAAVSLVEARRLVAALAPADLDGESLSAALSRVCARAVIEARFATDGEATAVPMPVEAALVRIAQSALANVEQHAGARARAAVTLSWSGGHVRLDVVDDGQGFDPAALISRDSASFGLDTMRHRVADLGGDFVLESEPGHTALAVSFPLQRTATA